jgi:very-short-patch-repair endonuclease
MEVHGDAGGVVSGAARRLRRDLTLAERSGLDFVTISFRGLKFRRQMPIERFIADFACVEARLVVELDGGWHAEKAEADALRTHVIEDAGYVVLRFWNDDVLSRIDVVMDEIDRTLAARTFLE